MRKNSRTGETNEKGRIQRPDTAISRNVLAVWP